MEENIINLGEWNCPTKWEDINLKTYSEIERFYEDKEKNFDIREVIHILCDKTVDEVNSLPIDFLNIILQKLSFLQEKPEEKEATNKIVISGETYSVNTMEKLKTGEYVQVDTVLKSDKHNYAAILAILCRKQGEIYDSNFEAEILEDRIKLFENQPVLDILPIISFFLHCYMMSATPSLLYSKVEEAINLIQQNIDSSEKIGAFKRFFMNLQMRKLRKSLKSISSTSQTRSHSLPTSLRKGKWKKRKMRSRRVDVKQ